MAQRAQRLIGYTPENEGHSPMNIVTIGAICGIVALVLVAVLVL